MEINSNTLDELTMQAKNSERLRMGKDMRTTVADSSQRMLNALEPGTVVPIHRHENTTETVALLRGKIRLSFLNDQGETLESVIISAGDLCPFYMVPQNVWHKTECLESGTIIFDAKDGAFEPLKSDDILDI